MLSREPGKRRQTDKDAEHSRNRFGTSHRSALPDQRIMRHRHIAALGLYDSLSNCVANQSSKTRNANTAVDAFLVEFYGPG